jgi:hypothetical protein
LEKTWRERVEGEKDRWWIDWHFVFLKREAAEEWVMIGLAKLLNAVALKDKDMYEMCSGFEDGAEGQDIHPLSASF